ncbi:MAG: hypothetical protein LBJ07_02280 [Actinomycetes bacterium]|jgi:glucose-6-phosphate isomerase|nr:hypothetical protein [Actinomycetes bacterium]
MLNNARKAPSVVAELQALRQRVHAAFTPRDIVVLGMGGSTLAARVLSEVYTSELRHLGVRLRIIDTSEPHTVSAALDATDAADTLVLVSSKSGATVETKALCCLWFAKLRENLGSAETAATHFIALSDADSPLQQLAHREGWQAVITTPADTGGRFSALTAFGLAPLVLAGIDPGDLLKSALSMEDDCLAGLKVGGDPASSLAAVIYERYRAGRDKLLLVPPAEVPTFGLWLEQLLAESLGKDGHGIIPLPCDPLRAHNLLVAGRDCQEFVLPSTLSAAGMGAELVRWIFATQRLGQLMGVNPLTQPDVAAAKVNTEELLARGAGEVTGSELLGSGKNLSTHELAELRGGNRPRLDLPPRTTHLVLLVWLPETREVIAGVDALTSQLERELGVPVCVGYGPRYLHSTGQLHKGGPDTGAYLFLSETETDDFDLPLPERPYTLRQLYAAQMAGDQEVLRERDRALL